MRHPFSSHEATVSVDLLDKAADQSLGLASGRAVTTTGDGVWTWEGAAADHLINRLTNAGYLAWEGRVNATLHEDNEPVSVTLLGRTPSGTAFRDRISVDPRSTAIESAMAASLLVWAHDGHLGATPESFVENVEGPWQPLGARLAVITQDFLDLGICEGGPTITAPVKGQDTPMTIRTVLLTLQGRALLS
ncbi:hypothetical protein [Actinokineospora globicatena]|uniref:hypothetical protein n=1 Tax=Actinokineospora globicatena TaxID=103729 RepID=UPI0020A4F9D5|nr:hypothetical protein [Actinokineospora globicatena]MCP2306087.1 hypothetical protein [Actinokineospora globicatena]GLW80039.1 hypothetical protein Aglo01_45200 [Actinokineospora globicatena]GLW86868.1 hypothetical protein Aglo02_45070 [Actinokineospora globicatena]